MDFHLSLFVAERRAAGARSELSYGKATGPLRRTGIDAFHLNGEAISMQNSFGESMYKFSLYANLSRVNFNLRTLRFKLKFASKTLSRKACIVSGRQKMDNFS